MYSTDEQWRGGLSRGGAEGVEEGGGRAGEGGAVAAHLRMHQQRQQGARHAGAPAGQGARGRKGVEGEGKGGRRGEGERGKRGRPQGAKRERDNEKTKESTVHVDAGAKLWDASLRSGTQGRLYYKTLMHS